MSAQPTPHVNPYQTESTFHRFYSLFTISFVFLLSVSEICSVWKYLLTYSLLIFFILYTENEYSLFVETFIQYSTPYKGLKILIYIAIYINIAWFMKLIINDDFIPQKNDTSPTSITYVISKALSCTIYISSIFVILRWILFFLSFATPVTIRRGMLAMLQRIALIVRWSMVFPYWLEFFSDGKSKTILSTITSKGNYVAKFYILIKFVYISISIWEFDRIWRYYQNSDPLSHLADPPGGECENCKYLSTKLCRTRCGHVVCQKCLLGGLFCPICHDQLILSPFFTDYNGEITAPFLLSSI